jgi:3-isopropylmalate/(R)-2-methylmalate dehydratase small subunit
MNPINIIRAKTAVLSEENIDTDRIIPARFLTTTERKGLGRYAFNDWRFLPDGSENPDFALNKPDARGAEILVAGRNFGCGSSREHAPWALQDFGIRAVLSSEIADIFRGNALKNGLLAIVIDSETHQYLLANAGLSLEIDLQASSIRFADGKLQGQSAAFSIDAFARECLLAGMDQLAYLQTHLPDIERFEASRRALVAA